METTHDYRIDRLRLFACFGVVMLHSSYGSGMGDLALNALFRFSVPVFVIISGYFAFTPSFSRVWHKALRLFLKMVLCSGVCLLYSLTKGTPFPSHPVLFLLTEPIHLWYLYATMGLYLLTPALRPLVRGATREEYRYALGVCFVLGCCVVTLVRLEWLPILSTVLDKSKLPTMLGFTGLYLLGGYFRRFGIQARTGWICGGLLCSLVSVAVCQTIYAQHLLSFLSPNVVICGAACFVLCMTLPDVGARFRRPLRGASECTMGVYLFHTLICDLITPYLTVSRQLLGGAAAMAVRAMCTFLLTLALVWLLRRVPIIRKWML